MSYGPILVGSTPQGEIVTLYSSAQHLACASVSRTEVDGVSNVKLRTSYGGDRFVDIQMEPESVVKLFTVNGLKAPVVM